MQKNPLFKGTAFNCPLCNAYAHITWHRLFFNQASRSEAYVAICGHCRRNSFWVGQNFNPVNSEFTDGIMIYPNIQPAPLPHEDIPDDIRPDFEEARAVVSQSPRAAAALLRLCVQKLCVHLGEPGKNINDDIGSLVKKGLPVEIQQALDIVRVIGNNSVHPGAISNDDVSAVSSSLFDLINYIVEDRISRPKKLASMFSTLPSSALAGISARDGSK